MNGAPRPTIRSPPRARARAASGCGRDGAERAEGARPATERAPAATAQPQRGASDQADAGSAGGQRPVTSSRDPGADRKRSRRSTTPSPSVTPALAGIAVLAVLHGHRRRLALVASVLVLVAMLTGWPDQVAATIVTALGCLTIGAALVRLTPSPWLGIGVLAMCGLDVLLLSTGVGQAAARLLDAAVPGSGLPALDRAGVGPISADYPDLILAAVVGGILAGRGCSGGPPRWRPRCRPPMPGC